MTVKRMKAVMLREFRKPLTIEEKAVSEPGSGEVLVKIRASGLCVSDLRIQNELIRTVRLPYTPDHKMVGEVAAIGPGMTKVKIGDRITAAIDLVCGSCRYCLSGRINLCRSLKRIGSERDGSHQEYCAMPEENAFPVADWIPFDQVAGFPDVVGCICNAIKNRTQIGPGPRLLILGTGDLGMNIIRLAKIFGAEVYTISRQKAKLDMVLGMGADGVIDAYCQDLEQEIGCLTGGEMCNAVIDNISIKDSINQVLKVTAPGGRAIVCDYQYPHFTTDYQDVMKFEKGIAELRGMARQDLKEMIRLVESRKVAPFVYQTTPFEAINEDLRILRTGTTKGRIVLRMEK